jgi:hypothetical protein
MTSKINSNNYLLYNDIENHSRNKVYLTDTNINMKLIFNDLLEEDIIIKDIIIYLKEYKKLEIHSTLKDIIDCSDIDENTKDQILFILRSNNYIIPYNVKFFESFNGSLGKIKLIWTTKSLIQFENNKNIATKNLVLKNENEYDLPNMDINKINIKFDYKYTIKNDNEIYINVEITNKTSQNKKLTVKIINSEDNSYLISGTTKMLINLKEKETKRIKVKLIALRKGDIKLPDILIKEKDYNGHQISCNYFSPEKIVLQ